MKSKLLAITIGLLGILALTGCSPYLGPWLSGSLTRVVGSGHIVTESRNVSEFDRLVVNGAGRVLIDQTGTESLEVTTDDNLLPIVTTEVRGGTLYIGFQPYSIPQRVTDLTFKLTVKELKSIDVNGAAALDASHLSTDRLNVDISGAAAVKLAGQADRLDVTLQGAGALDSEKLEAKNVTVTNNGAGAATINASDELNATVNGIGVIRYIGNPRVTQGIHGIGVVTRR